MCGRCDNNTRLCRVARSHLGSAQQKRTSSKSLDASVPNTSYGEITKPLGFKMGIVMKGLVDPESILQRIEDIDVAIGTAVYVLGFRDESNVLVGIDIMLDEDPLVDFLRRSIADQELVLIELDLLFACGIHDRDTCTTVVHQDVFELVEQASEHRHIDVFTNAVLVFTGIAMMAGFQNDVDGIAQARRQIDEQVKQSLSRCRCEDYRNAARGIGVGVFVVFKTLARNDLHVISGANSVGQFKRSIACSLHVAFELVRCQGCKTRGRCRSRFVVITLALTGTKAWETHDDDLRCLRVVGMRRAGCS